MASKPLLIYNYFQFLFIYTTLCVHAKIWGGAQYSKQVDSCCKKLISRENKSSLDFGRK